jgi:VWFA-related protein
MRFVSGREYRRKARLRARGFLALGLFTASTLFAQDVRDIPAFPTQADAITADVVVLDKQGRPVRGLTKEDFTLLEDGRVQTIVGFEARDLAKADGVKAADPSPSGDIVATNQGASSRGGRSLAFLVDDLGTQALAMEDVKKAVARWLDEKSDPRDEVTLATTSGDVWWSDQLGRGRTDLVAVLARVKGKKLSDQTSDFISDWEAYRIAVYEDAKGPDGSSASAASQGGSPAAAAGPPSAAPAPIQSSLGNLSDRVYNRWIDRGVCPRSPPDPGCPARIRQRSMELYNATTRRIQAVFSAVERLSKGLAGARGRKSILVFSEGFLNDTHLTGFDRTVDASRRGNTAIYFIDAKGLAGMGTYGAAMSTAPQPGDLAAINVEQTLLESAGSEAVADATGGMSVRNTNDLLGGLERVAEESAVYYLLGYQPEKTPDGKWHKLEVKVSRPGLKVRSRKGYQATPPGVLEARQEPAKPKNSDKSKGPAKGPTRPLDPAVMSTAAADAIALRIAPYVRDVDEAGLARVLVALEVSTSSLSLEGTGDRRKAVLDLTVLGVSRDEPKTFPIDERVQLDLDSKAVGGWWTLSREVRLPAGVAQVRVLVRDVASQRAGTVTQRLVVPALDRPYLATPILTDQLETAKGRASRMVPVAHRRFRPQGKIYCMYEVFGMKDAQGMTATEVEGGYTLKTADGRLVNGAAPSPISIALGGRIIRMLTLPIDGLAEGDYELGLQVVDHASGRTLAATEPFTLQKEPSAGAQ